jgi:Protein of unknown function (DUF2384)
MAGLAKRQTTKQHSPSVNKASKPQVASNTPKNELERLSPPAIRAFIQITDLWDLSVEDQITLLGGQPSRSTFFKWKKGETTVLSRDQVDRVSYLVGIFKALGILFPNSQAADSWIKKPNAAALFGGKSALEFMLSGSMRHLELVRQYLDAQRGGWS